MKYFKQYYFFKKRHTHTNPPPPPPKKKQPQKQYLTKFPGYSKEKYDTSTTHLSIDTFRLHVFCVHTLVLIMLRLRENKNINGIKVKIDDKAHIIKISQLADDTTLFVSSKTDIALAMNEIEIFGSFSGLILNRNKTEGIWIGKLKNCKDKIRGIKWTQNPVKALGIFIGHNKEECQKLNWEKKIEEMKNQFTAWE